MSQVKIPTSLRSVGSAAGVSSKLEFGTGSKTSLAFLLAAGSIASAEAQQSTLPPVTVDAPVTRPKPPAAKPTAEDRRVRSAVRRQAARQAQQAQPVAAPAPNSTATPADVNPYADPAAPYKADRLASPKFTEPVLNTPRSITVLTKEILADKNSTSLRDIGRTTAGITLGTGEGGNAFGDRFFIRGFDARNDVFIDGVRDASVSIRENFFTEQVEILRGPASSFAGRGTAGGAINIVTKQAGDRNFYNADVSYGNPSTKRVTMDVNQVIDPTLSFRVNGMAQDGAVPGRNLIEDDRWGTLGAVKWKPRSDFTVTANYIHSVMAGMPDFGVPWDRNRNRPFTDTIISPNQFYGFVNRDFMRSKQDIGSLNIEYRIYDGLTVTNKTRYAKSFLNYIGTLPEAPRSPADGTNTLVQLNPQSRLQWTDTAANQTDFTAKYNLGPVAHTTVFGVEVSREKLSFDSYTGLQSEALPGGSTGVAPQVSVTNPPNFTPFPSGPRLVGNPTYRPVDTTAGYVIHTANYQDVLIANVGGRFDDYQITASNNTGSNSLNSGIFSYNGGLVFKPLPYASIYAAYATSANPVGGELDGTTAQYGGLPATVATNTNQVFAPERNRAAEVGTKWELFDRHLLVTAALFQTTKDNARELGTIGGVANTVVAGASYRIRGVDLGVAGKITDRWSVYGGLVLMESEVLKSLVAPANVNLFTTNVGLPLANIAHESFNLMSKYKFTDQLEIGAAATWRSQIYGGTFLAANQGTEIGAYWRFDTFAEYKIDKHFTAKLFVNNIFDKRYYDSLYQSIAPFVIVAPGRSITGMLSAKF